MTVYLQGIDVSHYERDINWEAVRNDPSSLEFAYIKATEGSSTQDGRYATNIRGAQKAGLLCGAYHFFVPSQPVQQQVDNFVRQVGNVKGALPPMLDVEQAGLPPAEYAAAILQWLEQVGKQLGCTPGIYTAARFWRENIGTYQAFQKFTLWIAQYTSAPRPAMPANADYTFWQYSDSGAILGIAGSVTLNRFGGTLAQLDQLRCR